jgi:hypothetical protein
MTTTLPMTTLAAVACTRPQAGPPGRCSALCWRPFSPGVPPLLLVGCGGEAVVWQFVLAFNSWQVRAEL